MRIAVLAVMIRPSMIASMAASMIALTACAAPHAAAPSLNVQPQIVYVDRPVPCVKAADVPQPPAALPARPSDARAALDIALAKIIEYLGYAEKADPILRACSR